MNGSKALLDSNVIIYCSQGLMNIDHLYKLYDEFYISIITYIEVLGFKFRNKSEEQLLKRLLSNFEIIYLDLEIAESAIGIRKNKRIKIPDAVIIASAKIKKCDLITRNVSDFKNVDREVKIVAF